MGFDCLPTYAKDYLYRRLAEISPAERITALEILKATKPEFAAVVQLTIAQDDSSCQKPAQALYPWRQFVSPLTTFGRLSCGLTIFEMLSMP